MRTQKSSHMNSIIQEDIKKEFTRFLQLFEINEKNKEKEPKYLAQIKRLFDTHRHLLIIEYQDLISFNSDFANLLFEDYYKYQPILNQSLTQLARQYEKTLIGVMEQQRKDDEREEKYQITFDNSINHLEQVSVRDLRCDKLGKLFCFKGTVTRTTEVRPELVSGIFRCKICGTYSKSVPQQFKYTQPKKCFGRNCDMKNWQLDVSRSDFSDFQKLRVQEDPTKIPPGAMPRSIDVILRNENTEKGQPGDICKFVGYLCVLPQIVSMLKPGEKTTISTRNVQTRGQMMEIDGVKGIKGIRQLNYKLIFIATNVVVENNQFRQEMDNDQNQNMQFQENENQIKQQMNVDTIISKAFYKLTQEQLKMMMEFKLNNHLYQDMANSLFPSIFGQIEIKKAILLQLFGGIHKITKNKISIRGDINILIVGDPSTAKSQFLKAVNKFVPRSVYTNGKTTSAAGLTATVTKDDAGSVGIEAGALMLADNGICCIDEFDKMNYSDQTAIHEAMQQQTISIAKAGVYATLNARTSILAAANPIFGRYDKSKSLKNNINISAPIMSRFDLFFVVCDETNDNSDANLSEFIINMHRNKDRAIITKYDMKSIKLYISTAKKLKPMLSFEAAEKLRAYYKEIRIRDKNIENTSYRVTVRQLQSMIRISQALSRLYLDPQIKSSYVEQAYKLISTSIMKLEKSPITINQEQIEDGIQRIKVGGPLIKGDIALQRELQQKRQQKKSKQISISHELYQQIQKNVIALFKQTQKRQSLTEDQGKLINIVVNINQQTLVNFLLGVHFEAGMVNTEEQSTQMKKIINAVVKKLIREQRVLMIVQDNIDPSQRILKMHPNFID